MSPAIYSTHNTSLAPSTPAAFSSVTHLNKLHDFLEPPSLHSPSHRFFHLNFTQQRKKMRGKFSSKSRNGDLEVENLEKLKEPHLSGAYIRCLVKELTSSRIKNSSSNKESENSEEGISSNQNFSGTGDGCSNHKQEKSPQQHKKQVRRRLHTSRPYQERLLNMAEARREIVTALKFHRAAMKQASGKQQQQQKLESGPENQSLMPLSNQIPLDQESKFKSRWNPRIYASNSSHSNTSSSTNLENFPYSTKSSTPYPLPASMIASSPHVQESLNFALPSQALGLNLNLEDFNLVDTPFDSIGNPSSIYSKSSLSPSSSAASGGDIPCMVAPPMVAAEATEFSYSGLHSSATDDTKMAEIRSIGEQHQMEWNDTMNIVTSAWWFNFLEDIKPEEEKTEDFVESPFYEVMEFPAWLNPNDTCLQHVNYCCSDDYFQNPALPCLDFEEIEGMDVDWLG